MKILTIMIAALVGTLILNGPIQSYADPQLDSLLRIATQARDNLSISISQITNVPDEITQLYKQGSDETDALATAVDKQDASSARQHFLSAMKFFKTTNDKLNSLNTTASSDQQRTDIIQLQSEITRMETVGARLKTIALTNHVDLNFTQLDQLIKKAKQNLDESKINDASKSIQAANQFVIDAHHSLATTAQQRTSDRAKDFTVKEVARFNSLSEFNTTENVLPPVNTTENVLPPVNVPLAKTSPASQETPQEMIAKLRKLVAEGNIDEALKVIKSLEAYKKETIKGKENPVPLPHTNQNMTSITPGIISPPVNPKVPNSSTTGSSEINPSKTNDTSLTNNTGSHSVKPHANNDSNQGTAHNDSKTTEKQNLEKQKTEKKNLEKQKREKRHQQNNPQD